MRNTRQRKENSSNSNISLGQIVLKQKEKKLNETEKP